MASSTVRNVAFRNQQPTAVRPPPPLPLDFDKLMKPSFDIRRKQQRPVYNSNNLSNNDAESDETPQLNVEAIDINASVAQVKQEPIVQPFIPAEVRLNEHKPKLYNLYNDVAQTQTKVKMMWITPDAQSVVAKSYRADISTPLEIEKAVQHLAMNNHLNYFETAHASFELVSSIDIIVQFLQRSGLKVVVGKYGEVENEYSFNLPSFQNNQLGTEEQEEIRSMYKQHVISSYKLYNNFLQRGLAHDEAKYALPLCIKVKCTVNGSLHDFIQFFRDTLQTDVDPKMFNIAKIMLKYILLNVPALQGLLSGL